MKLQLDPAFSAFYLYFMTFPSRLGGRNHPPALTSSFNRLKPPLSICQKVVNTGQYESEWSIENSKGPFCGGLRYLYKFYVLSIEKRKKILLRALFMMRFPSQDGCTEFCITVHVPNTSFLASSRQNRITIQVFFAQF